MDSVKKSLSSDNEESEEQTSSEQEFQRLLKNFSKKTQEVRKAEKRHKHFLSSRDKDREKQNAVNKKRSKNKVIKGKNGNHP